MATNLDPKNVLRNYIRQHSISCQLGELSDLEEVGEGGNGLVYTGNLHNTSIAVKFLVNSTSSKLQRFKAEFFNILLLPTNEYIVKLLSYEEFSIDGILFPAIIMKKYDGNLNRPDSPTLDQLKFLTKFLLNSVGFIHKNGIIHRDLKPDNILINGNELVLSDFGIASFNPEIFSLKAKTKKNERIANRLFSAPEQEEANTQAHPTMDIYAIGQTLYWYVTGRVHRGTDRANISTLIPNSELIDSIVEKCLSNNPERRFQSIEEIINFIKENNRAARERKEYYYDDPYKYIYPFDESLSASFPKDGRIIYTEDKAKINRLMQNIADKCNFENELRYVDSGDGSMHINFTPTDKDFWLMGLGGHGEEIKIKSVWVNHDSSYHASFVLINCETMQPFGVYETDTLEEYKEFKQEMYSEIENDVPRRLFLATEEACLVDDEIYITRGEYDKGYAEIGSEIIDLSEHKKSVRIRTLEEKTFVVASSFHSILQPENESVLLEYLVKYNGGHGIDEENFSELIWKIRKHQHYLVSASM